MRSYFQIIGIIFILCGIACFVSILWNGIEGFLWGFTLCSAGSGLWMVGVIFFPPHVAKQGHVPAE